MLLLGRIMYLKLNFMTLCNSVTVGVHGTNVGIIIVFYTKTVISLTIIGKHYNQINISQFLY